MTLAERKADCDAVGGPEAFPYDSSRPLRHVAYVEGLEKLCFVPCRRTAKQLYELFWLANNHGSSKAFKAEVAKSAAIKARKHHDWVVSVGADALEGKLGPDMLRLAASILQGPLGEPRKDDATLATWEKSFKILRSKETKE